MFDKIFSSPQEIDQLILESLCQRIDVIKVAQGTSYHTKESVYVWEVLDESTLVILKENDFNNLCREHLEMNDEVMINFLNQRAEEDLARWQGIQDSIHVDDGSYLDKVFSGNDPKMYTDVDENVHDKFEQVLEEELKTSSAIPATDVLDMLPDCLPTFFGEHISEGAITKESEPPYHLFSLSQEELLSQLEEANRNKDMFHPIREYQLFVALLTEIPDYHNKCDRVGVYYISKLFKYIFSEEGESMNPLLRWATMGLYEEDNWAFKRARIISNYSDAEDHCPIVDI